MILHIFCFRNLLNLFGKKICIILQLNLFNQQKSYVNILINYSFSCGFPSVSKGLYVHICIALYVFTYMQVLHIP